MDVREVTRRQAAITQPIQEKAITGTATREFATEDQKYVLVNILNTNTNPASEKPALRVLGFFGDAEEATEHAQKLHAADPTCSIRMITTCAWYLMGKDERADANDNLQKVNRLLKLHTKKRLSLLQEFENHRDSMRGGREPQRSFTANNLAYEVYDKFTEVETGEAETKETGEAETKETGEAETKETGETKETKETGEAEETKETKETGEADGRKRIKAPNLSAMHELRGQKFVVLSFMDDLENGTEPGLCIYGGFSSESDAKNYTDAVAKPEVLGFSICGLQMYEWIYPDQEQDERIPTDYRYEELDRIMNKRRVRDQEVASYKLACQRMDRDVTAIEIPPDITEDGTRLEVDAPDRPPLDMKWEIKDIIPEGAEETKRDAAAAEEDEEEDESGGVGCAVDEVD